MSDAAYTIDRVSPDTVFNAEGRAVEGYRADFTTAAGIHSYVRVPRSTRLEQDIHEAVAAETEALNNVMSRPIPPDLPKRGK